MTRELMREKRCAPVKRSEESYRQATVCIGLFAGSITDGEIMA